MITVLVRPATAGDIPALVPLLARAFAHDPVTCWVAGAGGPAQIERLMRVECATALPYGLMFTTTLLQGAALWHPPHAGAKLGWAWSMARTVGLTRALWAHVWLGLRVVRAEPRTPHYYLSTLGVLPEFQGRGIGSALLAPMLARCDREGAPAYLLAGTEKNVRFYGRHGFVVRATIPVGHTGLTTWGMWRAPVAGGNQS